jgi:hypothetical protein
MVVTLSDAVGCAHLVKVHSSWKWAVIKLAFDQLRADWLFAGHDPRDRTSARLLARLGFGYLKDGYYPPTGSMHPSYRLDDPEFEPG